MAYPLRAALAGLVVALAAGCGGGEPGAWEPLGSVEQRTTVCRDRGVLDGIDVSYYQGTIDWPAVAASGQSFAIARINHGDFMDPKFQENWDAIRSVGMIRGAYQFYEPTMDPAYQAQIVIDAVGPLGPGDLPVTLDAEVTGGAGPAEIVSSMHAWIDLVEAGTGRKPLIYTGKYFWNDNVGSSDFASYPLWVAQYGPDCPDLPSAWADWAMWQYSSTGSVPGISGDVDLDYFNGTYEQLVALAGGSFVAELVSLAYPTTMRAGEDGEVTLVVKNAGGRDWGAATQLGTTEPRDRESAFATAAWPSPTRPAAVTGTVTPGSEHSFTFPIRAPLTVGTYVEHFNLVEDQVAWFSDPGQGGPADDAIALSIRVVAPLGDPPETTSAVGAGGAGASEPLGGGASDGATSSAGSCQAAGAASQAPRAPLALLLLPLLRRTRRSRSRGEGSRGPSRA
jgi:lysozyme